MNDLVVKAIEDEISKLRDDIDNNKYLAWRSPNLKEKLENQNEKLRLQIQKYEQLLRSLKKMSKNKIYHKQNTKE